MRVGLFTDTYFPQISGVATSIKTLKTELEKLGHEVFIFTTTEKTIRVDEDPTIIRLPSVPFVAFSERRVVYSGLSSAYKIAKEHHLDIIHTQTEFSVGIFGWMIAKELGIPVVHTYHTHYEDYVHYIAKGRLIRPGMVKYFVRNFLRDCDGVICPSRIVLNILNSYNVKIPKRIIPTGIELEQYKRPEITTEDTEDLRQKLGIAPHETMLLSLSRISYEKNIQAILRALPFVLVQNPNVKCVIVGDGPYLSDLMNLVAQLGLNNHVIFTGMVAQEQTAYYYKAADFLVSASTSETQGLTYTESLASGTPIIAQRNSYLQDLLNYPMLGYLYDSSDQLAEAIVTAIAETPPMTKECLEQKLYELSAERFGLSVYELYVDAIISKNYQVNTSPFAIDGKKKYTHIKIMRNTFGVPSMVVKTTAQTSVKVLRTPKRFVDRVRNLSLRDTDADK
ncbi:glycosyltransferase family 4 protein [Streptococcus pluranimalium]|uniref:glycosyltransferase family 4 protein n=1 Tax=Streptococcus hyovaginalis TaxID=149015 RepID=UPI002A79E535|nr:glycosyltransferase family 4 protein [Streptococcus hyovaginalis]MDY3023826.1 glycosyltransferase family 4 protein [Streptococcus hyovaginalis]MDY5974321.1 glycosyltransferase family 4 protein [Streptococcus hyovaginalis]